MTTKFVDTSGWAAWVDRSDVHHAAAVAEFDSVWSARGRFVTTNYVLAELTALFNRTRVRRRFQEELFDEIAADPSITVVHIDPEEDRRAWKLWRDRPDKPWSLVDCASFVVMARLGVAEAVTADHHFEQAGFVRLLR